MDLFYFHSKKNIQTTFEDILLFATNTQNKLVHSPIDTHSLIILRPDRPDLILSVLLGCQNELQEFLITRDEVKDDGFLESFGHIQIIETHHLEEFYEKFSNTNQLEIEKPLNLKLIQEICLDSLSKVWFKTSGSSGSSKYIQQSFQNFITSTKLSYQSYLHQFQSINWALNLSIDHIGGFMALFRSFYLGHKVEHFFWREPNESNHANTFSFVPTQVFWILENPDSLLAKLFLEAQLVVISGGKITDSLVKNIRTFKKQGNVVFSYGATETCSQISVGFYDRDDEMIYYRPFQGVQITPNEDHVTIQSPTNAHKIYNDQIMKSLIKEIQLNDLIEFYREPNFFKIKGRTDQIIISGGENISLNYVKETLESVETENDFILIGAPDEKWGEVLIAFHLKPIIKALPDLKKSLELKIKAHEIPKYFYHLDDVSYQGAKPSKDELILFHQLNKTPWFAFHGFMGDRNDWLQIHQAGLTNLFPFDLNEFHHASNWKETSDLICQQIDSLAPNHKINLIGYSMGARVLLSCVRPLRERIDKVIIISSHLGDMLNSRQKHERQSKDLELLSSIKTHEDWSDFLERWYDLPLFQGVKETANYKEMISYKTFEKINDYRRQLDLWTVAKMPNFLLTYPKELIEKTYFITGDLDEKYNAYSKELSKEKSFPHITIKGHSHALLNSASKEIYETLISLMNKN